MHHCCLVHGAVHELGGCSGTTHYVNMLEEHIAVSGTHQCLILDVVMVSPWNLECMLKAKCSLMVQLYLITGHLGRVHPHLALLSLENQTIESHAASTAITVLRITLV